MHLRAARHIVPSSMRTIETCSTENMFNLWCVFARCQFAMENRKRYENMAWRLWAFKLQLSATSQACGKHMTPIGLGEIFNSIQKNTFIEPLPPLPAQLTPPVAEQKPVQNNTTRCPIPEVSTSVDCGITSPEVDLEVSTSTEASKHSEVRGFEPGHVSISVRSSTNPLSQQLHSAAPTRTLYSFSDSWETAIESDSEDYVDESAIEEEDSDEMWEDDEESGLSRVSEHFPQFPRVKVEIDPAYRRSLLTTALHQGDSALDL
ncbi:DUF3295 multi-domain protein [Pyrenophora tritici-repentis]|uniref:DUF3295 multi-domain protein n=1 Tax=Pyrenophora tritici-repentis TaxID=45151 RepID=A0A317AH46_9PLEO|nr:DUF3295 multi-domain protein [Pyrenophora tritici-repentis]